MTMNTSSKEFQLERAIASKDLDELMTLHKSSYMNVRRAVARNKNIDSKIANNLLFDPVLNVSYAASLNPKCSMERRFADDTITVCVCCEKDERKLDCVACEIEFGTSLFSGK